jgi:hypothetical protein
VAPVTAMVTADSPRLSVRASIKGRPWLFA